MKYYSRFLRNFLSFRVSFNHLTFAPKTEFLRNMSLGNNNDSVYEVSFKSCGTVYQKWKKEGKFWKLPKGDLEFKVNYVDTQKNISLCQESSMPTVVALHGAPGSHKDFSSLTSYLNQNGVRVVIPNFPDFSSFEPGVFRHTDEEKAQFVKDFLKTLNIQQVDSLIVHSSAVYAGLLLCLENYLVIKSLVMLNPGTFTYDMKSTKGMNLLIMKWWVASSEIPIYRKLLQMVAPLIFRMIKMPVRPDNYLNPLLSSTAMVRGNILEAKEKFLQISKNKLPILYAFSDDDTLMGKECSYNLAHLLGFTDSDIYIYDTNGALKQTGRETPLLKVISFENGSHYVFWKYADIINREVHHFVAKL